MSGSAGDQTLPEFRVDPIESKALSGLSAAFASGTVFSKVLIDFVDEKVDPPKRVFQYELSQAMISSCSMTGGVAATFSMTLNSTAVAVSAPAATPPSGKSAAPMQFDVDVITRA